MENIKKEISITNNTLVLNIQNLFNSYYPFLNIEFSTDLKGSLVAKNQKVHPETSISKLTSLQQDVIMDINDERTVAEVEKDFREKLGLNVQFFRKSGNVWNVITLTDSWTLNSQNKAAEFISSEMAIS